MMYSIAYKHNTEKKNEKTDLFRLSGDNAR